MSDLPISPELFNRATAGNSEAQFELAEIYMQSDQDAHVELAEEWALKAAQLGHVEAMYWLGEGYTVYAKDMAEEDAEESKAHFELGYYWLSKANMHKHPTATLELAGYFRRGDVIEKDVEKSVKLVTQAAELGEDVKLKAKEVQLEGEKLVDDVKHSAKEAKLEGEKALNDLKKDANEHNGDLKDKLDHLKTEATQKLDEAKLKANELKQDASEKFDDLKAQATEKLDELQKKASDILNKFKS